MKQMLLVPILFSCSFLAWSHGYVEFPESRAYYCQKGENTNCGPVQYEPQSLEGPKGFPQAGPADGKLASAGIDRFSQLDEQSVNRWKRSKLECISIDFRWKITAKHKTTKWEYFITKKDWNPNAPLTRNQFESTPFCKVDQVGPVNDQESHSCRLPVLNHGPQTVLAVWTIADTPNAFYQVIDLNIVLTPVS